MIQRSVLRQIRASSSRLQIHPVSSASRPFFPAAQIPALSSRQQLYRRCYSTTAEANASTEGETSATEEVPTEVKEEDPVKQELEAKKAEVINLKVRPPPPIKPAPPPAPPPQTALLTPSPHQDKYLRSVADFRNLQERTKRETQSARDFAISRFARDLVESIDNLDRALSAVPPSSVTTTTTTTGDDTSAAANKDLVNLFEGLKMTEQILMATLKKHGLERFDPSEKGERFDPNLHEATFMTKVEGKEDGTAFHTQQKGFLLNGRVIRAAKVGVVKNS